MYLRDDDVCWWVCFLESCIYIPFERWKCEDVCILVMLTQWKDNVGVIARTISLLFTFILLVILALVCIALVVLRLDHVCYLGNSYTWLLMLSLGRIGEVLSVWCLFDVPELAKIGGAWGVTPDAFILTLHLMQSWSILLVLAISS